MIFRGDEKGANNLLAIIGVLRAKKGVNKQALVHSHSSTVTNRKVRNTAFSSNNEPKECHGWGG